MSKGAGDALERTIWDLLCLVGENPSREGLLETPRRVAQMYRELLSGYTQDPDALFKTFEADGYDEMVVVRDIPFTAFCEHHILPFTGVVHAGYIPKGKVIGLSKIGRLVEVYSRRLQIQERMTTQIAETLDKGLTPNRGVMVVVEAEHLCMVARGVQKPGSKAVTSAVRGDFLTDPATRDEFLSLIRRKQ